MVMSQQPNQLESARWITCGEKSNLLASNPLCKRSMGERRKFALSSAILVSGAFWLRHHYALCCFTTATTHVSCVATCCFGVFFVHRSFCTHYFSHAGRMLTKVRPHRAAPKTELKYEREEMNRIARRLGINCNLICKIVLFKTKTQFRSSLVTILKRDFNVSAQLADDWDQIKSFWQKTSKKTRRTRRLESWI